MPRFSAFYGVTIWIYGTRGARAPSLPRTGWDYQASVDVHGDVVVGWLPARALGFVSEWALLHATSYRPTGTARDNQPRLPIEPLA